MTTQAWSFGVDHTTDAGFRAWGVDFAAKLAAVGLTQTADTGQINWVTVNRAGTNADAGYEVWRFNDTAHATAPIYLKFYYGTADATTRPRIRIELGTGSNGSGTITGTGHAVTNIATSGGGTWAGTTRNSFMCYAEGFFGFVWCIGAASTNFASAGYLLSRSCDSDGVPTDKAGLALFHPGGTSEVNSSGVSIRWAATAINYGSISQGHAHVPGVRTTKALANGDVQAFLFWMETPEIEPAFGLCAALEGNITRFTSFSTTLVGTTARTYLQLGGSMGIHPLPTTLAPGVCMLYE